MNRIEANIHTTAAKMLPGSSHFNRCCRIFWGEAVETEKRQNKQKCRDRPAGEPQTVIAAIPHCRVDERYLTSIDNLRDTSSKLLSVEMTIHRRSAEALAEA